MFMNNYGYNNEYNPPCDRKSIIRIIVVIVLIIASFCFGCYCCKSCNEAKKRTKVETKDGNRKITQTFEQKSGSTFIGGDCSCGDNIPTTETPDYEAPENQVI